MNQNHFNYPYGPVVASPFLRIVNASYGKGARFSDVTGILQQMVHNKGGLTLQEFGYFLKPNGCMNKAFGDPCRGEDKELRISYQVTGASKRLVFEEDKKVFIDLIHDFKQANQQHHVFIQTTVNHAHHHHHHHHHGHHGHHHHHHTTTPHTTIERRIESAPVPSEVHHFVLEILSATYGYGMHFIDVTSIIRSMVASQGGKSLNAFGYVFSPNGCMNKAFGDPAHGKDKFLTIDYRWTTPTRTLTKSEDRQVSISYDNLRSLLV